jgi:hypothetical protein
MPDSVSQDDVSTLVERLEDAAWAYMRGDMERYLELVHHARGFTLLAPGGGPPVSYENRADGVRASVGFFKGGESRLENVEVHRSRRADRAAARGGWRATGPGLVAAGYSGLSTRGRRMAAGASPRRPAGPSTHT